MTTPPLPRKPAEPVAGPAARPSPPRVRETTSLELLGGAEELLIRHHGAVYRLRLTRQDKLILTK